MCGIAGYISSAPVERGRIAATLELMDHRGPDNAAHESWRTSKGQTVELLHTRLNIIDLDPRANQPLRFGSRWIVYNGELYNYLELRRELAASGSKFLTDSDTEVLLGVIDRYGWDGLDRCEGMWSFASYDETTEELTLCRDRFGEKPLYIYRDATGIYFGSEAKFIFGLLGKVASVNKAHLYRYLVNGYKSLYKENETFFEDLEELAPGTALHIAPDGSERAKRYWGDRFPSEQEMSFDEAVLGARERLIRSMELRLRADVPVAFCMSGGVDSLSLISIAKNVLDYDVHGYTIVNSDSRYEEQEMVDYAVKDLGVRHTPIALETDDFIPKLRSLVRHHDAPVYTITYFVQWLLMQQIAADGYRVSVSGTAADELFTGYYDHHLAYLYEVRNQQELAKRSRAAWSEHVKPIVRNPHLGNPDLFVNDPDFRDHIYLGADEFKLNLKASFDEGFSEVGFSQNLLRNRMLNELFAEAVPVILHEDDLNSMFFSIENRSPFLDRELFEFTSSIPTRHLIQDGKAKAVLRESMRGIAPTPAIENRRKVGFNAPIHALLDTSDPATRDYLLADSPIFDHIHRDRIVELLDQSYLPNSQSKFLFNFLNSKIFLEEVAAA